MCIKTYFNTTIQFIDLRNVHLDTRIKYLAGIEPEISVSRFSEAAILKSNMASVNQLLSRTIQFLDLKFVHPDTKIKAVAGIEPEIFVIKDFKPPF